LELEALVYYKVSLIFEPQPEGGYTVTSPLLPELLTEGDTVADAIDNVRDALAAVLEIYQEQGKSLPPYLTHASPTDAVRVEMVVAVP
jgi:antitoxin HicB